MQRTWSLRGIFGFVRGNILVLAVSGSIGMFCRSMVFPYTPLYILALGGDPARVGLVYALGPLGGLFMFPIAGHLADRVNRGKLIAYTGYFSSFALFINAVAPSWEWIAGARMLQGFAVFQFPATSAIVADSLPPENRARGLATMAALSGSVALLAPYVAGSALDAYGVEAGMRVLYGVMGAAYAVGATINLLFLKETRPSTGVSVHLATLTVTLKEVYAGIPGLIRSFSPQLRAQAVVITICFIGNGVASPFWVVYAKTHIGLSSGEWGLILLVEMGLQNLTAIPAGFIVDRYGRTRFMLGALLILTATIPLFAIAGSFIHVLLIRCTVAIASAFFGPASAALLADTVPSSQRGRVMAAIGHGSLTLGAASGGMGGPGTGFLVTLPLMMASFAGGMFYDWIPSSPWLFVMGVSLVGFAVTAKYVRDPKEAER